MTQFHAGTNTDVIREQPSLSTCRTLSGSVRDKSKPEWRRSRRYPRAHGLTAEFTYDRRYPVLVNTKEETLKAIKAAQAVAGANNVIDDHPPTMGSEFAWMLQHNPAVISGLAMAKAKTAVASSIIRITISTTRRRFTAQVTGPRWWNKNCLFDERL